MSKPNAVSDLLGAAAQNAFSLGKLALYAVGFVLVLIVVFGSTYVVSPGRYGVVVRLGEIARVADPGLHMKFPLVDAVHELPSSLIALKVTSATASRDIQEVSTQVMIQYHIPVGQVANIYKNYGTDIKTLNDAVIGPSAEAATKTISARYNAADLVAQREKVTSDMKALLAIQLKANAGVTLAKLDITNFQFTEGFTKSIENKVIAEQDVLTAKQTLEKSKVDAQKQVADASAEAEATRLRADAEAYALVKQASAATPLTVRLREADVRMEMAKRWNPKVIGADVMTDLGKIDE